MKRVWTVVGLVGMLGASPAMAKEPAAAGAKQEKDPKAGIIKDEEAVKWIQVRLQEQSGSKGWKVELKELAGTSREFTATNGNRSEKGTVNVSKSYPNEGALRVYLVPRD
jgi:hypothetical protein